ncbi:MAG: chromate transporter [Lachnospiraceae bacterium]
MIYLQLFLEFLKVGCFAFGGAYGAIPLIRDAVVVNNAWITEGQFSHFIAVSESTPGPIMINMATYIGSSQGGFLGAVIATLGVVIPSFVIILMISKLLKKFMENKFVRRSLDGVRPAVTGIVCATGLFMLFEALFGSVSNIAVTWQPLVIAFCIAVVMVAYKLLRKKQISPIILIILSAVLGIVVY